MSRVHDVSEILGEYMLKGWVLTNDPCPNAGCSVPLMRSPSSQIPPITFCAQCDGVPGSNVSQPSTGSGLSISTRISHPSEPSTPPTEVSEVPSSPDFTLPPETEETRRRREQSDRASTEIGKKLLQGWAMLGDECPNSSCFGIPLVRPPNVGGERSPRKHCVICGNNYTTEVDEYGQEVLALQGHPQQLVKPRASSPLVHDTPPQTEDIIAPPAPPVMANTSFVPHKTPEDSMSDPHWQPAGVTQNTVMVDTASATFSTLEESRQVLQRTLGSLNSRLVSLISPSAKDPMAIAATAEAIAKVTQAITQIRQLQWSENQIIHSS